MPNQVRRRVMVVEDDASIQRLLKLVLENDGHEVLVADDGRDALDQVAAGVAPELFLVDWMMPRVNGIELIQALRENPNFIQTPILMLTAKGQAVDKYEAFSAGAHDFVSKPFDPLELVFRIRSLLSRISPEGPAAGAEPTILEPLTVGRVHLEPGRYLVRIDDRDIVLSKLETAFLHYLMRNAGQVYSAKQLSDVLLGKAGDAAPRSVDAAQAHIRHLRQKIERDPASPELIVTVGRKGYAFQA